jgi:hypothetical protein
MRRLGDKLRVGKLTSRSFHRLELFYAAIAVLAGAYAANDEVAAGLERQHATPNAQKAQTPRPARIV